MQVSAKGQGEEVIAGLDIWRLGGGGDQKLNKLYNLFLPRVCGAGRDGSFLFL